jgi:hypothetical protein
MNRLKKSWPQNKEATEIKFMNFESELCPVYSLVLKIGQRN